MPNSKRNLDDWNDHDDDLTEDGHPTARRLRETTMRPGVCRIYVVQACRWEHESEYPEWSPARGRAIVAFTTRWRAEEYVARHGAAGGPPLAVIEVEVSTDATRI